MPVDCTPGQTCTVQHYVDQDAGPGAADYACGYLTYDGHKGTDIRLADRAAMQREVGVLAAAGGTVWRTRDGMPDISVREEGAPPVGGREAGNSVIIDHGGGWHTQYGHLLRGSVSVEPGDTVLAGERIGAIGLSGQTEFPHLHFEVRLNGDPVDPFTGVLAEPGCGQGGVLPLWTPSVTTALAYHETGLLAAGLVGSAPTSEGIRAGAYADAIVDASSEALVFWVSLYGIYPGDRQSFTLTAPDGSILVEESKEVPGPKQEWRAWAGHRRPAYGWPRGTYKATYRLTRADDVVVEVTRTVEIR